MKYIFSIILLLPFALHAKPDGYMSPGPAQKKLGELICIRVNMGNLRTYFTEHELRFPAKDGKLVNPLLPSTTTLAVPGATAIVKVTAINENAANVECELHYMHSNKCTRFLSCFLNQNTEEIVTRNVTVDMTHATDFNFGNSTYLQSKKSSQVIPADAVYLAGLRLQMYRYND